jgi:hypothetical protein
MLETMFFFQCPGMSWPLDSATPARPPKVPSFGQERYIFMFWGETNCACGHSLKMTQIFHAIGILPDPPFFPFVLKKGANQVGISDASRPLAPLTLVVHLPLVVPLCCTSLVPLVHSAGCPVTSNHAAASHPPAPPPLIALPPLITPLLHLLSGWLSRHLLSRCLLLSTCASASHHTAASHRPPLTPLVRLVVASPLAMPPPPVLLRLRLSLHRRLSPRPSRASCPAGCCVTFVMPPPPIHLHLRLSLLPSCNSCPAGCCITSCHAAAASCLPAPPPLIVSPPLIAPLLHLLSGWLLHHLSSCSRLPSTCASASQRISASHCTPLLPLIRLVLASPLIMPPSPVRLHLCLSSHCRLSLQSSCTSCPAGCHIASHHSAASHPPGPPPLIALLTLTAPLSRLLSGWLSRHLLSRCGLPSPCASASHGASLMPLVHLVVTSPLVMPLPPPIHLRLCLSLFSHLSLPSSCASYPAGCRVISCHAATSHPPGPPPLIALPPLTAPLLLFSSGWLLHHLLSRHCLLSACASASHCTATSHRAPLAHLVRLVLHRLSSC